MSFKGMITLLLCAGLAGPALAQDPVLDADEGCGTKLRLEDVPLIRLREALGLYAEPRAMAAQEYTIPLTIHVVRRTNGTEGLAQDRIDQAIADANEIWAPAEMQFCQWGPTRYVDDDEFWWYLDDFEGFVLRTIDVLPNTVNVYFAPSMGPCGRASFTHSGTQGILIANGCAGTAASSAPMGRTVQPPAICSATPPPIRSCPTLCSPHVTTSAPRTGPAPTMRSTTPTPTTSCPTRSSGAGIS
jgi:hypothetical protein